MHSPALGALMAIHCLAYLTLMRQEICQTVNFKKELFGQSQAEKKKKNRKSEEAFVIN